jgi:hypothetical protein
MIRTLYLIAALGWMAHLVYWLVRYIRHKRGLLSAEEFSLGLFQDYTLAIGSLVIICLIGLYGIYLGGI